ncbi:MAG: hypothetical protein GY835_04740 [bacterium]|nr:hypothetical protein [bacterium]
MCNRARQNVFGPRGDIVLSDRDPRDLGDRVRDSRDIVLDSDPVYIFGHIGDTLGSVRDPSAIFFSDPHPSLWLTERLKR